MKGILSHPAEGKIEHLTVIFLKDFWQSFVSLYFAILFYIMDVNSIRSQRYGRRRLFWRI